MKVHEIMTAPAVTVSADTTVNAAALRMRALSIGALVVVDGEKLVGIVTDRDIAVELSVLDDGRSKKIVSNIMTSKVVCCDENEDVSTAAALMGENQIRRLPVLDRQGQLKGLISIGDIAVNASERLAGEALGEISEDR